MGIDIRLPIGLMFVIFGVMMTLYGFMSNPAIYARSLGMNINTMWGAVLILFGAVMLLLGWRSHKVDRINGGQALGDQKRGH